MMQRIQKLKAHEGGFTLIELLIVIVILGILSAIVVFAVNGISDKGTLSACKTDASAITSAAEAYFAQSTTSPQTYPATIGAMVTAGLLHPNANIKSTTGTQEAANGYTITYAPGTTTAPSSVTSNVTGCP